MVQPRVRKDLCHRNHIYYLASDVEAHPELGFSEHVRNGIRAIISDNHQADKLWAKLQTYDPVTHEPIPRSNTVDQSSSTSTSTISSTPSVQSPQIINPTTPNVVHKSPFPVPSIAQNNSNPLSSPVSVHSTNANNVPQTPVSSSTNSTTNNSTSTPTPHIAKSFRSPPPSDYFVNNAANLSYLSISQYFKLPLHEACVALRVDESSLKKRCRELGIRRWPYRKRCNMASTKGAQQQVEESSASGDQLFSCFQLNKGKGSPVVQKMKSEEALALEALGNLHAANSVKPTTTTPSTTVQEQPRTTTTTATTTPGVVSHQPPRTVPPTTGVTYPYPYPPHPGYPHMYPPHPGYHFPYGVPPPSLDGSQPVPPPHGYPMPYPHYPPQTAVPPPGTYPPTTEAKEGQPQPAYVQPYYYYPYPPPQSGSVPPYPYPQPGYTYPPHPEQSTYPYPPHGYPMAYPPQMGYPQPVPPKVQPQTTTTAQPVIVSTSPAESQPVSGTPCRTVSSSTSSGEQTPTTPVGSPQTKMVYQRETKVLHPVRYKPPSPTETTAEIAAKIKRERIEEQEDAAKKVRRDLQIANPLCSKPTSQNVQNGPLSASIKVADK